jgi:nucleoside-diphosphate-sugar epimerase
MLVPRLVETIQSGREVRLAGRDGARLNPVHVDDVVAALMCAVDRNVSGIMNVAGPDVLTIRQMSEAIGRLVGLAPRFALEDGAEPDDLSGDITIMREQLGSPRRPFDQGVANMIEALRHLT